MSFYLYFKTKFQKWVGQNQVPNIHFREYSMFPKPKLDEIGLLKNGLNISKECV